MNKGKNLSESAADEGDDDVIDSSSTSTATGGPEVAEPESAAAVAKRDEDIVVESARLFELTGVHGDAQINSWHNYLPMDYKEKDWKENWTDLDQDENN